MTWNAFNILGFGAKPIWLVRITVGTVVHHFTIGSSNITTPSGVPTSDFTAQTSWVRSGITIGGIEDSGVQQKRVVKVGLPRKLSVASTILALTTPTRVAVDVWQGFQGDPDNEYQRFFLGTAKQKKPTFTRLTLECFDELENFNNQALARAVQRPCPYSIYSTPCGALKADHRTQAAATAIDGLVVTVANAALQTNGFYSAGIIEFGSLEQRIRNHVGDQLTLHAELPGLSQQIANNGSADINILPGCTKSAQICIDRFNNSINHGGFEDIEESPYDGNGIL